VGAQILGATGDPLPAPAITENTWASIDATHRLLYLGGDWVLDWVTTSGDFRVWSVERNPAAGADPLPAPEICKGNWAGIRTGQELVYLGKDRLLDWEPASGNFRVWLIDRSARGNGDPIPGVPQTTGRWSSLDGTHQLISLDENRVLDWKAATGEYRVWRHDAAAVGAADPLPGPPLTQGTWTSIRGNRRLIPVGQHRVIDWEPVTGDFRVWIDVPGAAGDPFPGDPEVVGNWSTVRTGHDLLYLDGDRVLDREQANGHFRLYRYDRNITTLRRGTVRLHLRVLTDPRLSLDTMVASAHSLYASYGIDLVEVSRSKIAVDGTSQAHLQQPYIDCCSRKDGPTAQQIELFSLRDNIGPGELVVYFVRETSPSKNGCAVHPPDQPGAIVARTAEEWTLAHEIGHVLGLNHLPARDNNRLMTPGSTLSIINPPPDLATDELATIFASPWIQK
jgi:hypothetical protein